MVYVIKPPIEGQSSFMNEDMVTVELLCRAVGNPQFFILYPYGSLKTEQTGNSRSPCHVS